MGPSWDELRRVQLLDPDQKLDEKKWEAEFQRRRDDLAKQQKLSSKRRMRNSAKLAEMSARWRSLEHKRVEKSEFYLERLRTSLSMALRQETMSPGSTTLSER